MSKTTTPQGTKVETFMLDEESGKLFRKGEHIATRAEDGMKYVKPELKSQYGASVTRWLNQRAKDVPPADPDAGTTPTPPANGPEASAKELRSLATEGEREKAKAEALSADDKAFAVRTGCPPPPKKNPQFGDKTPAYVEWLKEYRPSEFRARFGVTGKGQVPVFEKDADGVEQHVGYREADMATRKTHLTEKRETDKSLGADESWDA